MLLALNLICVLLAMIVGALRLVPDDHTAPFFGIFALLSLVALNLTVVLKRKTVRMVALGMLGLGLALTFGEGAAHYVLTARRAARGGRTVDYTPISGKPFVFHDDVLGNVPFADNVIAVDYRVDDLSKKLVYTFDHNGFRITPRSSLADAPAILFFGCSMTFGEGVGNRENFPYLVGLEERDRYQVYNFAFCAQGPHHMYSKIRCGTVRSAVGMRTPALALYVAIPDHIRRVLGQHNYSGIDPCYVLEAGALRFRGCFESHGNWQIAWRALRSCWLYCLFEEAMQSLARRRAVTDDQVALFVALVQQSQEELRKEWPGLPFLVLFHEEGQAEGARLIQGLRAAGVRTLKVRDALPELVANAPSPYRLSWNDGHYSPAGHRLMARYIIDGLESGRLFGSPGPGPPAARDPGPQAPLSSPRSPTRSADPRQDQVEHP